MSVIFNAHDYFEHGLYWYLKKYKMEWLIEAPGFIESCIAFSDIAGHKIFDEESAHYALCFSINNFVFRLSRGVINEKVYEVNIMRIFKIAHNRGEFEKLIDRLNY